MAKDLSGDELREIERNVLILEKEGVDL